MPHPCLWSLCPWSYHESTSYTEFPTELQPQSAELHVGTACRAGQCLFFPQATSLHEHLCSSQTCAVSSAGISFPGDRPEMRTIYPGTDIDAYIPGKGAESLLQALNWLENLLKRHWSESPSCSGHRETGGSKQAKMSSPGSSARACLCPSDGCTGFRSQRLCSSCAGEEGSQTVVKSFLNNFSPQLPTFPN